MFQLGFSKANASCRPPAARLRQARGGGEGGHGEAQGEAPQGGGGAWGCVGGAVFLSRGGLGSTSFGYGSGSNSGKYPHNVVWGYDLNNDLTRPHPKWWFMWGRAPEPLYVRLVKYDNSPRTVRIQIPKEWGRGISEMGSLIGVLGMASPIWVWELIPQDVGNRLFFSPCFHLPGMWGYSCFPFLSPGSYGLGLPVVWAAFRRVQKEILFQGVAGLGLPPGLGYRSSMKNLRNQREERPFVSMATGLR